jgi:hypothetical protein
LIASHACLSGHPAETQLSISLRSHLHEPPIRNFFGNLPAESNRQTCLIDTPSIAATCFALAVKLVSVTLFCFAIVSFLLTLLIQF